MLYWLLYQKLFPYYRLFRIFRYLTFRTVFASLTALLIGLLIGPYVIEKLREFQIGQYIREEGPKAHQKKAGTPTMGGLLIAIAIVVPTLLWADLTNLFVWIAILSTCIFAAIGFAVRLLLQIPEGERRRRSCLVLPIHRESGAIGGVPAARRSRNVELGRNLPTMLCEDLLVTSEQHWLAESQG